MSKTSPALRVRLRDALPPCLALRAARAAFTLAPTVLLSWGWLSDTPLTRIDRRPNACHEPCPTQNENVQARHSAPAALASPRAPRFRLLRTHRKRKKKGNALPLQPCPLGSRARSLRLAPSESAAHQLLGRRRRRPRGVRARPHVHTWTTCTCPFPSSLTLVPPAHALLLEHPPAGKKKTGPPAVGLLRGSRSRQPPARARAADASRIRAAVIDPVCSDSSPFGSQCD